MELNQVEYSIWWINGPDMANTCVSTEREARLTMGFFKRVEIAAWGFMWVAGEIVGEIDVKNGQLRVTA